MTLADLSKVRVRALVDEIDVGKVSIGQVVSIKVAAYRDKEFFGTVSKVEPLAKVEQNVTLFPILIDIENKENYTFVKCDICDYSLAQKSIMKERNDLKIQLVNPIFIGKAPFLHLKTYLCYYLT